MNKNVNNHDESPNKIEILAVLDDELPESLETVLSQPLFDWSFIDNGSAEEATEKFIQVL